MLKYVTLLGCLLAFTTTNAFAAGQEKVVSNKVTTSVSLQNVYNESMSEANETIQNIVDIQEQMAADIERLTIINDALVYCHNEGKLFGSANSLSDMTLEDLQTEDFTDNCVDVQVEECELCSISEADDED